MLKHLLIASAAGLAGSMLCSAETQAGDSGGTDITASTNKSIIDAKYRNKYKNRKEWLSDLLKANASLSHEIPAKLAVGEEGKEGYKAATPARTVVDGVDVDALFKIGAENGLDLAKYEAQKGGHGFPGRFRMTVGNMLRSVAKQRHGITIGGEWQEAPEEWRKNVGAPEAPTHNKDGSKIAVAKAADTPATESKLIKADANKSEAKDDADKKAPAKKKK